MSSLLTLEDFLVVFLDFGAFSDDSFAADLTSESDFFTAFFTAFFTGFFSSAFDAAAFVAADFLTVVFEVFVLTVFGVAFSFSLSAVIDFLTVFLMVFSVVASAFWVVFLESDLVADVFFPVTEVDLAALESSAFFVDVFFTEAASGLTFVLIWDTSMGSVKTQNRAKQIIRKEIVFPSVRQRKRKKRVI